MLFSFVLRLQKLKNKHHEMDNFLHLYHDDRKIKHTPLFLNTLVLIRSWFFFSCYSALAVFTPSPQSLCLPGDKFHTIRNHSGISRVLEMFWCSECGIRAPPQTEWTHFNSNLFEFVSVRAYQK